MAYPDGNPTLGEQIEEDMRRDFYTADILKEAEELYQENKRLWTVVNLVKRGSPLSWPPDLRDAIAALDASQNEKARPTVRQGRQL